jgi:putative oxidoreductase
MMVDEFNTIGLGQWFRYLTGALELAGGVAILVPSVSVFAALVLLAVDVGAFITQIAVLHGDWIHTVVIAAILGTVIYLQRHRFGSLG